jgi:hypothetical protein
MGDRYRTADGWAVEVVALSATPETRVLRQLGQLRPRLTCSDSGSSGSSGVIERLTPANDGLAPRSPKTASRKSPIEQARAGLADRARRFRQLEVGYAASGDRVRQALCRGQALGAGHAAAALDEEIIQASGLWQQYDIQNSGPGSAGGGPPRALDPAERG